MIQNNNKISILLNMYKNKFNNDIDLLLSYLLLNNVYIISFLNDIIYTSYENLYNIYDIEKIIKQIKTYK